MAEYVDLSQETYRLYQELEGFNCYRLWEAVKGELGRACLVVFPTDSPELGDMTVECNSDVDVDLDAVAKAWKEAYQQGDDPIEAAVEAMKKLPGARKIYNVSEYDTAFIVEFK